MPVVRADGPGTDRRSRTTSARFPKFVIQGSTLLNEFRKAKGTRKSMILVPLFDLKFLKRACCNCCRNFKSAALEMAR